MPFVPLHVLNNSNGVLVSDNTSTITILDGDTLPNDVTNGYFHVSIEDEILEVTNVTMDSTNKVFTVTRAVQDTLQVIHTPGDIVSLRFTAKHITDLNSAVDSLINIVDIDSGLVDGVDVSQFYNDYTSGGEPSGIDWRDTTENLSTTGSGTFGNGLDITGNIIVTGNVDGVDISTLYSDTTSHINDSSIHIDWTNTTENLLTSGSGTFGSIDTTSNLVDGVNLPNLYSDHTSHINNFNNPHQVTSDQLGLGDVTSDIANLQILVNDVTSDIANLQTNLYDHTSNVPIHIDWTDATHNLDTEGSGKFGNGLDVTGNITVTGNVDGVNVSTLYSDFTSHTGNVLYHINWTDATHSFKTTSSGIFGSGLDITGNITVTGTVDGVNISTFYSDFTSHTGDLNSHIDWTNTTNNLLTTGTGTFSSIDTTSNNVDGVNLPQLYSDFTSHTGNTNIHIDWTNTSFNLNTTGSGKFGNGLDVTGNITITGNVDGVDISTFYSDMTSHTGNILSHINWTDATHAFKTTSSGVFGSTLDVTGAITGLNSITGQSLSINNNASINSSGGINGKSLTISGTLGNAYITSDGSTIIMDRPGNTYLRASNAAGSVVLQAGGSNTKFNVTPSANFSYSNIYIETESSPSLILRETATTTSYMQIYEDNANLGIIRQVTHSSAGSASIWIYPFPLDGTSATSIEFFRGHITTGTRQFIVYKGDVGLTQVFNINCGTSIVTITGSQNISSNLSVGGTLDVTGIGTFATSITCADSFKFSTANFYFKDSAGTNRFWLNASNHVEFDTPVYPSADNLRTLGLSTRRWSATYTVNAYISSACTIGSTLDVTSNITGYGTLSVYNASRVRTSTSPTLNYIEFLSNTASAYFRSVSQKTDRGSLFIDNFYVNNGTAGGSEPIIYFRGGDSTNPVNLLLIEENGRVTTTGDLVSGYATGSQDQYTYLVSANGYEKGLIFNSGYESMWKVINTTTNNFAIQNWDTSAYQNSITIDKNTNNVTIHGDLTIAGSLTNSTGWSYSVPLNTGYAYGATYSGLTTGAQREKFNYYAFTYTTWQEVCFPFVLPNNYVSQNVNVSLYWTGDDSSATGNVDWRIGLKAAADGTTIGETSITLTTSYDTYLGTDPLGYRKQHIHTFSNVSIPNGGSNRQCYLLVRRYGGAAGDTLDATAYLTGISIYF